MSESPENDPSDRDRPREPNPDESTGVVVRGGIALVGALVGGALSLVDEFLAARFLGLHAYGCYALAFTLARIAEVTSMFGLRLSVQHFLPVYRMDGRPDRVLGTILVSLAIPSVAATGFIVLIWAAAPWLAHRVLKEPDSLPYLRVFALAVPLLSVSDVLGHITRGFGRAVPYVVIRNFVPAIVYFLLLLVLLLTDANPLWSAGAVAISYGAALVVGAIAVVQITGPSLWRVKPALPFREVYAYSLPIAVNALLYVGLGGIDMAMLGSLRPTEDAGIYRGCMQLLAGFDVLLAAFNAAGAQSYPALLKAGRLEDLRHSYQTTTRWLSILGSLAAALFALNAVDLLSLLGPGFTAGAATLAVLLCAHWVRCATGASAVMLILSGHQRVETVIAFIGVFLNVVLNLWLIPEFGAAGAATATLAAHLAMNLLRVVQVRRYLKIATLSGSTIRILGTAVAAAALAGLAANGLGLADCQGVAAMAIRLPTTAALLTYALYRFGLDESDRRMIRRARWKKRSLADGPTAS